MSIPSRAQYMLCGGLCLAFALGSFAAVEVGEVVVYDAAILGDAAAVISDQTIAVQGSALPPALLEAVSDSGVFGAPVRPDVDLDCEVVQQWPAVSIYLNNVSLAVATAGSTFTSIENQAAGAVDLAIDLLDSVNAPPASACESPQPGGLSVVPAIDTAPLECEIVASRLKNIEKRLVELDSWFTGISSIRDDAFQLVNAVITKIASPGSFTPSEFACDRIIAANIAGEISSYRDLHDWTVDSITVNVELCTLENAMESCDNCDPFGTRSLVGKIGPKIRAQLANGAVQSVPPEPILVGLAEAADRIASARGNPEISDLAEKLQRRFRRLADYGRVQHVVVPVSAETTRIFVVVGRCPMDGDDGRESGMGEFYDAAIFTGVQRDSGLPYPNINDSVSMLEAARSFARRLRVADEISFEDLERNETLNRYFPDWRSYFR